MKSMYAQLMFEKFGVYTFETEKGFFTYHVGKVFYVEEIFIKPEFRGGNVTEQFISEIDSLAMKHGHKEIIGSVNIRAHGCSKSAYLLLKNKYRISHIGGDLIYFKRTI